MALAVNRDQKAMAVTEKRLTVMALKQFRPISCGGGDWLVEKSAER